MSDMHPTEPFPPPYVIRPEAAAVVDGIVDVVDTVPLSSMVNHRTFSGWQPMPCACNRCEAVCYYYASILKLRIHLHDAFYAPCTGYHCSHICGGTRHFMTINGGPMFVQTCRFCEADYRLRYPEPAPIEPLATAIGELTFNESQ